MNDEQKKFSRKVQLILAELFLDSPDLAAVPLAHENGISIAGKDINSKADIAKMRRANRKNRRRKRGAPIVMLPDEFARFGQKK